MSDPTISDEEVEDFCAKLNALDLSDAQRALLNAILKMAWDMTHENLDLQFDGCFEPDQAALIMAYLDTTPTSLLSPSAGTSLISRSIGPTLISRFSLISRTAHP